MGAQNHNDVEGTRAGGGEGGAFEPERLAEQTLEAVAGNGIAHSTADTEPEAVVGTVVGQQEDADRAGRTADALAVDRPIFVGQA